MKTLAWICTVSGSLQDELSLDIDEAVVGCECSRRVWSCSERLVNGDTCNKPSSRHQTAMMSPLRRLVKQEHRTCRLSDKRT